MEFATLIPLSLSPSLLFGIPLNEAFCVTRYRVIADLLINLYFGYWFIYERIVERSDCSDDGVHRE